MASDKDSHSTHLLRAVLNMLCTGVLFSPSIVTVTCQVTAILALAECQATS